MVAYTQDFCLPYFEGSDSPCVDTGEICAPSTVWCDMAAKIDAAFTAFDETISRAVTSFPYAQVALSEVVALNSGSSNLINYPVLWDTVVGDSDAMVDLNVDPSTVNLRRSGIWDLNCVMISQSDVNDTQVQVRLVHPNDPAIFSPLFISTNDFWLEPVPTLGTITGPAIGMSAIIDSFYTVDASGGPVPLQITLQWVAPPSDIDVIVAVCRFSARWVADLP